MRLLVHLLLFLSIGAVIVFMGSLYAESEDRAALKSWPKRFVVFVVGCLILTGIMLLVEHTLTSLD